MKPSVYPMAALAAFLTGCAGYNHTLFMTKSNAGLDFDAKPPTAEITISRKEAVIAPSFEGGQTPPVLASFAANQGFGQSFSRFFFGVSQTFAGGDAAQAMAELYISDELGDPSDFDSAFPISSLPKNNTNSGLRKFLFGAHEPGQVRPFVFGTDTTFGAKLAWSGVSGQFPDTVKVGFNRKEFGWAPVFVRPTSDQARPFEVKMPSFLATVDNGLKVENVSQVENGLVQYFATGNAATGLAMHPEVRRALHSRADPKAGAIAEAARTRVESKHNDADRIAAFVAPNGAVERPKLEALAKGTQLAQRQDWFEAWTGKPKDEFATALKDDYYALIPALAKNLPKR